MADSESTSDTPAGTSGRPGSGLGLFIATVVLAGLVIAGIALAFSGETYKSPAGIEVAKADGTISYHGQTLQHVILRFNTYPDASGSVNGVPIHPQGNPSWPSYGPTNQFQIPAHAYVTVYVKQYDSGGALNNFWFSKVHGTVNGKAKYDGKWSNHINPNTTGHTFTVRSSAGVDQGFFLSVPLPAVGGNNQTDNGQHHSIEFSFISGNKGIYAWNCEFPCGTGVAGFGGPMSAWGYMSGYIHVV